MKMMGNPKNHPDFRRLLAEELESRQNKNSLYSLRSFARDLGIASQQLSDILRGRYGISVKSAGVLLSKLQWKADRAKQFLELVTADQMEKAKRARMKKSPAIPKKTHFDSLAADTFHAVSEWYYNAIIELTYLKHFKNDPAWIADQLDIDVEKVKEAIERLKRLKLLITSKQGRLKAAKNFTTTSSPTPSEAIRSYHKQILQKAVVAIEQQAIDKRDLSSIVFSFNAGNYSKAKKTIEKFRRDFNAQFGDSRRSDTVYCLSVQFFSVVKGSQ